MELFQFHLLVLRFGSLPVTFLGYSFYSFLTDSKSASGVRYFNIYIELEIFLLCHISTFCRV
jgi:hypothetical protein